ncbi:DUF4162 domain-containing protein [Streptomyces sp. PRKS01-29]|nr:DUF4162 domain-containing protein [Streptomyces sabulosicollis]
MAGCAHVLAVARAEGVGARELAPFAKGIGAILPPLFEETAEEMDRGGFSGEGNPITSAVSSLTPQYLEEADQLADRIAVLHQGKLVAEGSPQELKRQVGGGHITLRFADPRDYDHAARTLDVVSRNDETCTLQIPGQGDVRSLRALLDWLDHASLTVDELQVHTPDLDDVFFALTGNPVTEQEPAR